MRCEYCNQSFAINWCSCEEMDGWSELRDEIFIQMMVGAVVMLLSIRQLLTSILGLLMMCNLRRVEHFTVGSQLAKALSLHPGLGAISLATNSLGQSIRYSAARGNRAGSASS